MQLTSLRLAVSSARPIKSALSRKSLKGREIAAPGSVATFDKNFPRAEKTKAWNEGNREKFFREKYAHVHAKQKESQRRQDESRKGSGKFNQESQRTGAAKLAGRSKSAFAKLKPIRHTEYVYGTSAVEAALRNENRAEGHSKLYVLKGIQNVSDEIIRLAKDLNVPINRDSSRWELNQMTENGVHNGYALKTRPLTLTSVESLGACVIKDEPEVDMVQTEGETAEQDISEAEAVEQDEELDEEIQIDTRDRVYQIHQFSAYNPTAIIKKSYDMTAPHAKTNVLGIYIDQVTDPHNLGAILRSAHFLGADFAILSELNCAKLSPVAAKAAAGALDRFPVYTCDAPLKLFEKSVASGWNIIATVPPDTQVSTATRVSHRELAVLGMNLGDDAPGGPCLLAVGSESEGLRKSLLQRCTHVVSIPKAVDGGAAESDDGDVVESLNVSVATALLISNFLLI